MLKKTKQKKMVVVSSQICLDKSYSLLESAMLDVYSHKYPTC